MSKLRTRRQLALHVSGTAIIWNALLSACKLCAGVLASSGAMVSDAVHSFSDVISSLIVIVGVSLGNPTPDEKFPYGHERLECVAAIIIAALLCATGGGIGYSGLRKIFFGGTDSLAIPGRLALFVAIVSIALKESLYWYTRAAAKRNDSGILFAAARHHRADALASLGGLIGIWGARMGVPVMDPIACVLISLLVIKVAYDIFVDAVHKLTDMSCDEAEARRLYANILSHHDVLAIDDLRTRLFGDKLYVDVDIGVCGTLSLTEAHDIADRVQVCLTRDFPKVKHCMVHVNPHPVQIDVPPPTENPF